MKKEKNELSIDMNNARDELVSLIDEFINLSNEETIDEENIVIWVYYLFEPYGFDVGLRVFQDAAAVGLCIFASDPKLSRKMKKIFGDDFTFLCEMLQQIIGFCNNIRANKTNLARLDKCKWEIGTTSHLSLKNIEEEKCRYINKLKNLKDYIKINTVM